jgi:hypothetical protein
MRPCQWRDIDGDWWECIHCDLRVSKKSAPTEPYSTCPVASTFKSEKKPSKMVPVFPVPAGPGTELKKLLSKIGIVATPTCSCNARAAKMDEWGPDVCEKEKMDEIVGWLREEATKRNLPFVDMAGRLIIRRAISNARKAAASCQTTTDSPSTDTSGSGGTAT